MCIKFLVLFVASIALWQVAKALVIKDQQPVVDVTQSAHVVVNSVSMIENATFSAVVMDEDETLPVQSIEEEKNETMNVKNDNKTSNVESDKEQVSMTLLDVKEEVQIFVNDDKDVDNGKSNVEDEKKEAKDENPDEARASSSDSDEDQENSRQGKQSQHEEENEGEQENDDNTNNDDNDNDD